MAAGQLSGCAEKVELFERAGKHIAVVKCRSDSATDVITTEGRSAARETAFVKIEADDEYIYSGVEV